MKAKYIIQGYSEMKSNGEVKDVSYIHIEAGSGNEALEKAKQLVEKPYYRIQEAVEIKEPAKFPSGIEGGEQKSE